MKKLIFLSAFLWVLFGSVQSQTNLIQGTIKKGATADQFEIWIKPNFTSSTTYLYQLVFPIAFPSSASPQPTGITVTIDPSFISTFGDHGSNNYVTTTNPVASATGGAEKYIDIVLVRSGTNGSAPQTWNSGTEYKVLTGTFTYASGNTSFQAKLADYQDGGSDGLGNFYTADPVGNYYITTNSIGNFYASAGNSTVGGTASAGYAQLLSAPSCAAPSTPTISNITPSSANVTWTAVSGATGYEYAVTMSSTPPSSGTATALTNYSATNLTSATLYYVHVRTVCGTGVYSSWTSTSFTSSVCSAPSPTVSNITTTTADVNWNAVSGSNGYEYAISTSATPPASGTAISATTYSATGLTPSTQYYFHLRSFCGGSNYSAWSTNPFNTQTPTCTSPSTPSVSNITPTGADISWPAVTGVVGYEYAITTSATPPTSGTATTATSVSPNTLLSNTLYYIHVRSNCGSLYSSWTSTSFTTASCPSPATPSVNNITSSNADISWSAVAGVSNYEYALSISSTPPASGATTSATSYSATGLVAGTHYYFHLRSKCGTGSSSSWVTTSFTTLCASVSAPTVSSIGSTSATINWSAVSGSNGYEYAVTTSSTPPSSGTSTSSTSVNVTALIPGTSYYAYVRNICGSGSSQWSSVQFTTLCPATTAPAVSNVTASSASVTWTAVAGVSGYQYAVTTSSTPPASGTNTTSTSYNATNLTAGTQYYVHVRSSCSAGVYSGWSSTAFATSCSSPSTPMVSNTGSSATISWSAASGTTGYQYAITTSATAPTDASLYINTTNTSATVSGLQSATQYYVYVRGNCGGGSYSSWVSKSFVTPCLAPVITADVNETTANITWTSVHGAMGYEYALTTYLADPLSGTATADTTHTTPRLIPGAAYYFHVRTNCGGGGISDWATVSFHTSGIGVYPNPVSTTLNVTVYGTSGSSGQLALYDATGKMVKRITLVNNATTIDMRGLAAGVYLMKYVDGGERYMVKVVKE